MIGALGGVLGVRWYAALDPLSIQPAPAATTVAKPNVLAAPSVAPPALEPRATSCFPESAFREEREALIIEQLQSVDPAQASARLAAFEARYPQCAYRQRIDPPRP